MGQTKRGVNAFSAAEKRALDAIVASPLESRLAMKKNFSIKFNKSVQSAHDYVRRHDLINLRNSRGGNENPITERPSPEPPKKKAAKKAPESKLSPREIRFELPIKRVEFENGKIIIIAEGN